MDIYHIDGAAYCADCAGDKATDEHYAYSVPGNEWPGKADSPSHCDACKVALGNPLTDEGCRYVAFALRDGTGDPETLAEWSRLYGSSEPVEPWRQVGGDMNPGSYGGTIARTLADGSIELIEIQPVREYVGDKEAADVGFPFWTKEVTYSPDDIANHKDRASALKSYGLDPSDVEPEHRAMTVALAFLGHGVDTDEGSSGWSDDVVPGPVLWWGSKEPIGPEYLSDEDADFRREVLGESDESDESDE